MPAIEPDLFFNVSAHEEKYVKFLNDMFYEGAKRGAADVHMLYEPSATTVEFGVSGKLQRYRVLDNEFSKHLDDKLRARANMSTSDRHTPLDGRMQLRYHDRTLDCRMSIVPTMTGQKMVVRLADSSTSVATLDEIWMTDLNRHCLMDILNEPEGIFVVCGPTGSGKSTTLYAGIDYLHDGTRNIFTLEHPVEKIIPGITQVNINTHITFAKGLRAALRQAPKIILIGEVRDEETADIAIQAANTGHLILITVHANNAAMAVTRLLDLGIDPKTLASSLRGVLSQRLVERLSPNPDRAMRNPTEIEMEWMERAGIHHEGLMFPADITGEDYGGRMPVMEMFKADDRVRKAIMSMGGEMPIFNAAMRQPQFETMAQASIRLAAAGMISIEQAMTLDREEPQAPETKRLGQVLVELGFANPEQTFAAAEKQDKLRKTGLVRRIGQILVEDGVCTPLQIIEAVGFTEGAPEMMNHFVMKGRVTSDVANQMEKLWRSERVGESLFHLYLEHKHLTVEDFNEPSLLQFSGRRVVRAARTFSIAGHKPASAVEREDTTAELATV